MPQIVLIYADHMKLDYLSTVLIPHMKWYEMDHNT